jgi:hypothetical protein
LAPSQTGRARELAPDHGAETTPSNVLVHHVMGRDRLGAVGALTSSFHVVASAYRHAFAAPRRPGSDSVTKHCLNEGLRLGVSERALVPAYGTSETR